MESQKVCNSKEGRKRKKKEQRDGTNIKWETWDKQKNNTLNFIISVIILNVISVTILNVNDVNT